MTTNERQQLIAQYQAGADEVDRALDGFPSDKLTAHPFEGKWSAAEIVHHLSDSETTSGLRLRKLLTEDRPLIQGYDQDVYATSLNYNHRDWSGAGSLPQHPRLHSPTVRLYVGRRLAPRRHTF